MMFKEFKTATKTILYEKNYLILFVLSSIIMTLIYLFLPVYLTPGNDIEFQLSITPLWALVFTGILAIAMGLLISMQVFVFKRLRMIQRKEASTGIIGGMSSIVAGIFASASCGACLSAAFAFIGAPGIIFLTEHRFEITLISFGVVLIALYLSSKKINDNCDYCRV